MSASPQAAAQEQALARAAARLDRLARIGAAVPAVVGVLAGLLVGAMAVAAAGESPVRAYGAMIDGVLGNSFLVSAWLDRAVPIAFAAVGTCVAFRAGLFNLGGEGQLVAGALAAAQTGLMLPFDGPLAVVVSLLAGATAGAVVAWVAGVLDVRWGVNLIVSTLLFNYIVVITAGYLVTEPLRDRSGAAALPQTEMLDPAGRLGSLATGTKFHLGMLLLVLVAIAAAVVLRRTVWGYELRMTGLNPAFAHVGGVDVRRQVPRVMAVSGGIIGTGGAVATLATYGRFIDGALTAPAVAWSGLVAALLAAAGPVAAAVAAVFLAALQSGAAALQRETAVPLALANVVQASIIIFATVRFGVLFGGLRRRGRAGQTT